MVECLIKPREATQAPSSEQRSVSAERISWPEGLTNAELPPSERLAVIMRQGESSNSERTLNIAGGTIDLKTQEIRGLFGWNRSITHCCEVKDTEGAVILKLVVDGGSQQEHPSQQIESLEFGGYSNLSYDSIQKKWVGCGPQMGALRAALLKDSVTSPDLRQALPPSLGRHLDELLTVTANALRGVSVNRKDLLTFTPEYGTENDLRQIDQTVTEIATWISDDKAIERLRKRYRLQGGHGEKETFVIEDSAKRKIELEVSNAAPEGLLQSFWRFITFNPREPVKCALKIGGQEVVALQLNESNEPMNYQFAGYSHLSVDGDGILQGRDPDMRCSMGKALAISKRVAENTASAYDMYRVVKAWSDETMQRRPLDKDEADSIKSALQAMRSVF